MKKMSFTRLVKKAFTLTLAIAIVHPLFAQQRLSTPQELKTACETSPGNIVTVSQSSTISLPVYPSVPLQVNCPCTLVITNEATLAFELSNLQFTGPLAFQSTGKGEVKVIKSSVKSPSISFSLGGNNSALSTSESLLQAQSGNISVTLGEQAKMELYGRLTPSMAEGLSSQGVVNISAGSQFTGSITDIGIGGTQGVQLTAAGFEAKLKFENVLLNATQGSIGITANGMKSSLEMMETDFRFQNASNIHFGGEEAGLKVIETTFWGPSYNVFATGGITIVAGSGNTNNAKIEMVEVIARNITGNFSVSAAVDGEKGNLKMEKSAMTINGAIVFQTGRLGSTEVKENSIRSLTSITIRTGTGGNCIAAPNSILEAPVVVACIPGAVASISKVAEKETIKNQFIIYPNPGVRGTINMNMGSGNSTKDIVITDAAGRMVKQWRAYRNAGLIVDNLRPGFYTVQVTNNTTGMKLAKKFLIGS